jgi:hypothetical protein
MPKKFGFKIDIGLSTKEEDIATLQRVNTKAPSAKSVSKKGKTIFDRIGNLRKNIKKIFEKYILNYKEHYIYI